MRGRGQRVGGARRVFGRRGAASVGEVAMQEALDVGDLEARVIATIGPRAWMGLAGAFGSAARRIEALPSLEGLSGRGSYVHLVGFHYANALVHVGRLDDALRLLDDGVARGRRDRNAYLLESWAQYGSLLRLAARGWRARAEAESYETIFKEAAAANFTAIAGVVALAEVATRTGDRKLLKAVVDVARRMPPDSTALVKRYGEWSSRSPRSCETIPAMRRGDCGATIPGTHRHSCQVTRRTRRRLRGSRSRRGTGRSPLARSTRPTRLLARTTGPRWVSPVAERAASGACAAAKGAEVSRSTTRPTASWSLTRGATPREASRRACAVTTRARDQSRGAHRESWSASLDRAGPS